MTNPKSFLYEQKDRIATITLNRPERLNAITFEVYHELTDFLAKLRDEKDLRVVVITGAGRAFCSGGDVIDIIGELQGRDAEGLLEFTRLTCALIHNMRALNFNQSRSSLRRSWRAAPRSESRKLKRC